MTTAAIQTVVTMLEQVPDTLQNKVVEHLAEYLTELREDAKWEKSFAQPMSPAFRALIEQAKKDEAEGRTLPLTDDMFE